MYFRQGENLILAFSKPAAIHIFITRVPVQDMAADIQPPPLVFDNGSCATKAGIAGESYPCLIAPTVVAQWKRWPRSLRSRDTAEEIASMGQNGYCYIGDTAQMMLDKEKDRMYAKYPLTNGQVNNWDDMEKVQ